MAREAMRQPDHVHESLTRRGFIKGAATLAVAHSTFASAQGLSGAARSGSRLAYIGTYTGGAGNGKGIYLVEMNPRTGELVHATLAAPSANPSWLAIHPSRQYLYASNEVSNVHGTQGSISAFAIDRASGALTPLNIIGSEGAGPAYISLDSTGKYLFVANYGDGSIASLPVLSSGGLASAVDVHRDHGAIGSAQAMSAPRGSFAISGHDTPHAHMICADPGNRFVLVTDLAQDRIYLYRFDQRTGKLTPNAALPFVSLPSGDGPRHLEFHPNGRWLYSIQEEASTVVHFLFDPTTGTLTEKKTISTLPPGFAGTSFSSGVRLSPDGRFLYAANRLHDTIAVFSVGPSGALTYVGEASTLGDYPVQFRIDPSGNFLYACNRHSDSVTSFRIHRKTGMLSSTGLYTSVGSPACITFLT